jgi:cell wall-associated NlpC family hydrolase
MLNFQPTIYDEPVQRELEAWWRTPYWRGQQCRGRGVDCVRFIAGVMDDLYGFVRERLERLPQDVALHSPATARAALRQFLSIYQPHERVADGTAQAGDVVVTGPVGGGPGHALIVGGRRGELWHAGAQHVECTGYGYLSRGDVAMHAVYRMLDRERWVA